MLMNGLKEFDWITNDVRLMDALIEQILMTGTGVRYAVVRQRPGKPKQVTVYIGRY